MLAVNKITDKIAFITVVMTTFITFQTVVITVFMAFIMLVITCEMVFSTVLTTVLIAFHTVIIVSLKFYQINLNGRVISSKYPLISSTINMSATVNTFLIVSHTVVKMLTNPSHIPLKKSEMLCHILMMAVDTFSHKPLTHSVMAPQFFMIAMIATTPAIIATIMDMIGRMETLSTPNPTAEPPAAYREIDYSTFYLKTSLFQQIFLTLAEGLSLENFLHQHLQSLDCS